MRSTRTRPAAPRSVASRLIAFETGLEQHRRDLDLQFRRIAQMQVEIDTLKKVK
ncbi:MAG TPA: hypothetical protein VFX12_09960 [Vicinamibacterales bacterium]|nr:hypothetical protein [Vicinamibacterales bacterium]